MPNSYKEIKKYWILLKKPFFKSTIMPAKLTNKIGQISQQTVVIIEALLTPSNEVRQDASYFISTT